MIPRIFVFNPGDISPLIAAAKTAARISFTGGSVEQRLFLTARLGEGGGAGDEEMVVDLGPGRETPIAEPPPLKHDPLRASNFAVRIAGVEIGFWCMSPLHLADGLPRTVCLQRAIGHGRELFAWRQAIENARADLREVEIVHLNRAGGEAASRWILTGCWPIRWSGADFHAVRAEVAMEEIELRYARVFWI